MGEPKYKFDLSSKEVSPNSSANSSGKTLVVATRVPAVAVREEGFTVLSEGEAPVIADIVFIHGLQGHPEKTWTYYGTATKVTTDKASKSWRESIRSRLHGSRSETPPPLPKNMFWPRDLLCAEETFRHVRIMTYGYDSHVSKFFKGPANQNGIMANGRMFKNDLEGMRRSCPKRPTIYVAHSLGGLVLKQALREARRAEGEGRERYRDLYESTVGIIFMGTPHRGSAYADIGLTARYIAETLGFNTNDRILRNLSADSEILEELRGDFSKMLHDDIFTICSFIEGQGFTNVKGFTGKVVDDASGSLDDAIKEEKFYINANHKDMCRFSGPEDVGYERTLRALSRYLTEIGGRLSEKAENARLECLKFLYEPEMFGRVEQVQSAYEQTFEWIWREDEDGPGFVKWLSSGKGVFWITGKPGSGKSTLMKHVMSNQKLPDLLAGRRVAALDFPGSKSEESGVHTITNYFFNRRGSTMQKSIEGFLRITLHQLLDHHPGLFTSIEGIWRRVSSQGIPRFGKESLKAAFLEICRKGKLDKSVLIFIDGLDENEDTPREMVDLLIAASSAPRDSGKIKIVVASRDWNEFRDVFSGPAHKSIILHEWTFRDIVRYVRAEVDHHPRIPELLLESTDNEDKIERVKSSVLSRAEGVFLWVKVVCQKIYEGLTNGDTTDEILERITGLPDDMFGIYKWILGNVSPERRWEIYFMLELVLRHRDYGRGRAIELEVFTRAIKQCKTGETWPKVFFDDVVSNSHKRRIRSQCGGIIEVSDRMEVQFLHQSAVDFFLSVDYLEFLFHDEARPKENGHHYWLKYHIADFLEDREEASQKVESRRSGGSDDDTGDSDDSFTSTEGDDIYLTAKELGPLQKSYKMARKVDLRFWENTGATHVVAVIFHHARCIENTVGVPADKGPLEDFKHAFMPWRNNWLLAWVPYIEDVNFFLGRRSMIDRNHPIILKAPDSFLCIAVQYGLVAYVLEECEARLKLPRRLSRVPLLHWTVIGLAFSTWNTYRPSWTGDVWYKDDQKFLDLMTLLLENGASPTKGDPCFGNKDVLSVFVIFQYIYAKYPYERRPIRNHIDQERTKLLLSALELLLKHGANPNVKCEDIYIDTEIDSWYDLLALNSGVSEYTRSGSWTYPFHLLCSINEVEGALLLLDRGADPQTRDSEGRTALHICCQYSYKLATEMEGRDRYPSAYYHKPDFQMAKKLAGRGAKITKEMMICVNKEEEKGEEPEDDAMFVRDAVDMEGLLGSNKRWRKPASWEPDALEYAKVENPGLLLRHFSKHELSKIGLMTSEAN